LLAVTGRYASVSVMPGGRPADLDFGGGWVCVMDNKRWLRRTRTGAVAASLALVVSVATAPATGAYAAAASSVDGSVTYQKIDGFGISEAFQRSNYLHGSLGLSAANQQKVLDLLFSPTTGAGFTILRNGIGSSADNSSDFMRSIAPTKPSSPTTTPTWVWDGSDNNQVWLSKQAMAYGVKTIYADAWSAPGYMKTNNSDSNGGTLCGVPGASCASGDWRQAYAAMLVKYIQLYADAGVPLTHVGFLNEPDLSTAYASMRFNGAQAADFTKVLRQALTAAGLSTKILCCETSGWSAGSSMLNQFAQDKTGFAALDVASGHGYGGAPTSPLVAGKPGWETEWSTFDNWSTAWDDGGGTSGFTWAGYILNGLTSANLSAVLYWWGAHEKTNNEALIRLSGDSYAVSARLWAFANFSRYILPGAVRVKTTAGDSNLRLAAFVNADGSVAVVALNNSRSAVQTSVSLANVGHPATATPHLTDGSHNAAAQPAISVADGAFTASVPARSLVTYTIS
jgi:glucuronoarabinoxylan endo-1,4-beta-xylanase